VVAAIVVTLLLPDDLRLGPNWALPVLEAVLLVVLIVADPGSITRRSRELRPVGTALVGVLSLSAMAATVLLIDSLVTGGPETDSASELLEAGAIVWISNNIAFALLYWELDSGGAAARAHGLPRYPDLAFPQQLNPHVVAPGWRPRFIDYLYLGFTNATALSPTDAMPLAPVGEDRDDRAVPHFAGSAGSRHCSRRQRSRLINSQGCAQPLWTERRRRVLVASQ
jgi:hypothetical protein